MAEESLKAANLKYYLVPAFVFDAVAIYVLMTAGTWSDLGDGNPVAAILQTGTVSAALPAAAILISHIIPPGLKAGMVFWRFRDILPGCRAFSVFAKRDPRIDGEKLWAKLGQFPADAAEQNKVWYGMYRRHKDDVAVSEAHQRYLFFRDFASASVLMLLCVLIAATLGVLPGLHVGRAALFLGAQYLVSALAARERGNRLVSNVLAAESAAD
jgi:hypothetical protein